MTGFRVFWTLNLLGSPINLLGYPIKPTRILLGNGSFRGFGPLLETLGDPFWTPIWGSVGHTLQGPNTQRVRGP